MAEHELPDLGLDLSRLREALDREWARVRAIDQETGLGPERHVLATSLTMIESGLLNARAYLEFIATSWQTYAWAFEEVAKQMAARGQAVPAPRADKLGRLSELEQAVLEAFTSGPQKVNRDRPEIEIRQPEDRSADPARVGRAFRDLLLMGYLGPHFAPGQLDLYRLTPWGRAYTVVQRRERLQRRRRERKRPWRKLETALPPPEQIGTHFEDLDIDFLGLSKATRNRLKRAGLKTAGDLFGMTRKEVLQLRGVGRTSVEEIEWELLSVGLELKSAG